MDTIISFIKDYIAWLALPSIGITDIFEIFLITFIIYHVITWVKKTKAWVLVKGLVVLLIIWLAASIFNMSVILWMFYKSISVGIIAVIIVFQPEFRKALEQLGQNTIWTPILNFNESKDKGECFSDHTIGELVNAVSALAKTKTGALIVLEKDVSLAEYEKTGIEIDSLISSQLLINMFEHNTPLHDGAIIIRGNRIIAATCYLPLSDNMHLSKDLGTRHRAGVGVSEASDCFTIIVSEETGKVSIATNGILIRNVDQDYLRNKLNTVQNKNKHEDEKKIKLWRGRTKNERKVNEKS